MVRSVAEDHRFPSRPSTVQPGTLISTGSPGGAGYSRDAARVPARPVDRHRVRFGGIGYLTTYCRILGLTLIRDAAVARDAGLLGRADDGVSRRRVPPTFVQCPMPVTRLHEPSACMPPAARTSQRRHDREEAR